MSVVFNSGVGGEIHLRAGREEFSGGEGYIRAEQALFRSFVRDHAATPVSLFDLPVVWRLCCLLFDLILHAKHPNLI